MGVPCQVPSEQKIGGATGLDNDAEEAEIDAAQVSFHEAYGAFMLYWANLERVLAIWFVRLSGMPVRRASAVFYSAKNFSGRADMIEAVMPHSEMEQEYITCLKQSIKKARQYNSFRNSVAHGQSIYGSFPRGAKKQFVLIPGGPPAFAKARWHYHCTSAGSSEKKRGMAGYVYETGGFLPFRSTKGSTANKMS